jgi:hypothetical protein
LHRGVGWDEKQSEGHAWERRHQNSDGCTVVG